MTRPRARSELAARSDQTQPASGDHVHDVLADGTGTGRGIDQAVVEGRVQERPTRSANCRGTRRSPGEPLNPTRHHPRLLHHVVRDNNHSSSSDLRPVAAKVPTGCAGWPGSCSGSPARYKWSRTA